MIYLSAKAYPKTGALLTSVLPIYELLRPRVFDLFVKHCRSEKLAKQAVTLGSYPEIEVKASTKFRTANGYYQGADGGIRNRGT